MSIKLMNMVLNSTVPGSGPRFTLLALADRANDEGLVPALGVATLCRKTGLKRTATFAALRVLEDSELIRREERISSGGATARSRFWINVPLLRSLQYTTEPERDADEPSNPFNVPAAQTGGPESGRGGSGIRTGAVRIPDPTPVRIPDGGHPDSGPHLSHKDFSFPLSSPEPSARTERTDGRSPRKKKPPVASEYQALAAELVSDDGLVRVGGRASQVTALRERVAAALAAGHDPVAVRAYLRSKITEAHTAIYVLNAFDPERLADITLPGQADTEAAESRPAACSDCLMANPAAEVNPRFRLRVDPGTGEPELDLAGRVVKCPACHPDVVLANN